MKKIYITLISIVLLAIACSKDRTMLLGDGNPTPSNPNDKFTTIDRAALAKLGSQTEKKTIKSQDDLPFVGSQGTQVWLFDRDLRMPDGSAVSYPFEIEMLELFTPKDMILHQMPTVSGGRLLSTAGEMNIRVYKDGKELKLDRYSSTQIIVPIKGRVDANMELFYGDDKGGGFIDWYPANMPGVETQWGLYPEGKSYFIFPERIGWINCDKFYNFTEAKTTITFSSENPPIENILIFLYFPDLQSLMQVYRNTSGEVPVGRTVKVVALGITKDDEYHSFFQEMVVQDKQKVEIKLTPTTKESFLKYLDTL